MLSENPSIDVALEYFITDLFERIEKGNDYLRQIRDGLNELNKREEAKVRQVNFNNGIKG